MALRQWMVTHEWMVKPTRQTEWIDRRGKVFMIAEIFTALGVGLYLVSLFYSNWWGMLVAWIIIMFLKIPFHLIYFGKPLRFWRTIIAINIYPDTAWGIWSTALGVIGGIFAFLVGIYGGFMMSYCKSVPFWNTALLPMILLFAGVADGFALMLAVGLADAAVDIAAVEFGSRIILTVNIILMAAFVWNATYQSKTAKYSAMLLLKGSLARAFWVGIVAVGMVIPLIISASSIFTGEAAPLLITAIVLHTIGAVALKYVILKAGIHNPILPVTTSSYH